MIEEFLIPTPGKQACKLRFALQQRTATDVEFLTQHPSIGPRLNYSKQKLNDSNLLGQLICKWGATSTCLVELWLLWRRNGILCHQCSSSSSQMWKQEVKFLLVRGARTRFTFNSTATSVNRGSQWAEVKVFSIKAWGPMKPMWTFLVFPKTSIWK